MLTTTRLEDHPDALERRIDAGGSLSKAMAEAGRRIASDLLPGQVFYTPVGTQVVSRPVELVVTPSDVRAFSNGAITPRNTTAVRILEQHGEHLAEDERLVVMAIRGVDATLAPDRPITPAPPKWRASVGSRRSGPFASQDEAERWIRSLLERPDKLETYTEVTVWIEPTQHPNAITFRHVEFGSYRVRGEIRSDGPMEYLVYGRMGA